MTSRPLTRRPPPSETTAADFAAWGPVHLNVSDLRRSVTFWADLVGLTALGESGDCLRLGVEDAELVVLHPGATAPMPRGRAGLYHLAIHLPSEAEFARVLARLFEARYPNSPTDHVMHWATYLDDPDGTLLELSFETLDRFARYDLTRARPAVIDPEGNVRDAIAPLDLEEVFGHLPGDRDLSRPMTAGTRIGHLHLHVAEIEPAVRFYEAIGFRHELTHPIGMAELSADGAFPHRLALNVWQGVGAPPAPEGVAGMRYASLKLRTAEDLAAALERLTALGAAVDEREGVVQVRDPSGNRIVMSADR